MSQVQDVAPVRRKTRSRAALLRAAQDLMAAGSTDLSVRALTERAEVSPQTLYNQFDSKDVLLAEAKTSALGEFERYMVERGKDVADPLEIFTLNLRLFGRAPDTHPYFAAIISNSPLWVLVGQTGYAPGLASFAESLVEADLLRPDDIDLALISTAASLEHMVVLRRNDPEIPEARVDDLVFRNLLDLGVPRATARRMVTRPLPPWPQIIG